LVVIIVTSLLATTILLGLNNTNLNNLPLLLNNSLNEQAAKQCIEYLIGQRRLRGYTTNACPSTATPGLCASPTGGTLTVNIACTTINGDANYKTITVSGSETAPTTTSSFSTLIASY
jgi:hypothetical protein